VHLSDLSIFQRNVESVLSSGVAFKTGEKPTFTMRLSTFKSQMPCCQFQIIKMFSTPVSSFDRLVLQLDSVMYLEGRPLLF
jgi:hypothetical protein